MIMLRLENSKLSKVWKLKKTYKYTWNHWFLRKSLCGTWFWKKWFQNNVNFGKFCTLKRNFFSTLKRKIFPRIFWFRFFHKNFLVIVFFFACICMIYIRYTNDFRKSTIYIIGSIQKQRFKLSIFWEIIFFAIFYYW